MDYYRPKNFMEKPRSHNNEGREEGKAENRKNTATPEELL
jgi:hypothetical protein